MPTLSVAAVQLAVTLVPVCPVNVGTPGALGGTPSRVVNARELGGPALPEVSTARTCSVYVTGPVRPVMSVTSTLPTFVQLEPPLSEYSYLPTRMLSVAALQVARAEVPVMLVMSGVPGAPGGVVSAPEGVVKPPELGLPTLPA